MRDSGYMFGLTSWWHCVHVDTQVLRVSRVVSSIGGTCKVCSYSALAVTIAFWAAIWFPPPSSPPFGWHSLALEEWLPGTFSRLSLSVFPGGEQNRPVESSMPAYSRDELKISALDITRCWEDEEDAMSQGHQLILQITVVKLLKQRAFWGRLHRIATMLEKLARAIFGKSFGASHSLWLWKSPWGLSSNTSTP